MFNFTAKSQYALKAVLDIGFHDKNGPVQRKHIALRQAIPTDYMDHILMKLRAAGLIQSLRGREGGYHLAKSPHEISLWDIAEAVEDKGTGLKSEQKKCSNCSYATEYLSGPALNDVFMLVRRNLRRCTVEMFLEDADDRMIEDGIDPLEMMEIEPAAAQERKSRSKTPSQRVPATSNRQAVYQ